MNKSSSRYVTNLLKCIFISRSYEYVHHSSLSHYVVGRNVLLSTPCKGENDDEGGKSEKDRKYK